MPRQLGKLIAIEGGDGSGKKTQTRLLHQALSVAGYTILHKSFPQYDSLAGQIVTKYLNGEYGEGNAVHADLASLPYAIDRYAAKNEISTFLEQSKSIALMDRYVASNLAHQGTKFETTTERLAYYERMMAIEYTVLDIPEPDLNIVLVVPPDISQQNIDNKSARSYTTKKRDIHEADIMHLEKAKANYQELCELYPDKYKAINCINEIGQMRSIDDIQKDIRRLVLT